MARDKMLLLHTTADNFNRINTPEVNPYHELYEAQDITQEVVDNLKNDFGSGYNDVLKAHIGWCIITGWEKVTLSKYAVTAQKELNLKKTDCRYFYGGGTLKKGKLYSSLK